MVKVIPTGTQNSVKMLCNTFVWNESR